MYGQVEVEPSEVILSDINASMLQVAKERASNLGHLERDDPLLSFLEANAEELPFQDGTLDAVTIAFGIRNCTHIDAVLREAFRVLKRGGRFLCLEFSHIPFPGLKEVYDAYSFHVIPTLGQYLVNDRDSYQYLVESIRRFPDQGHFAQMFRDAGFEEVSYTNLTFGVAAIHSGFKLGQ